MELIFAEESFALRGAFFEVHKHLGTGFLEKVYQESLAKEFSIRNIPFEREKRISLDYKGQPLLQVYIADFICYNKIIVECKAVQEIQNVHKAQVLNYLKAANYRLGFLVNFSESFLKPLRFVNFEWNEFYVPQTQCQT
ncbi:MAG: GxxExxY protein [Bacteroidales bacterium]|nr:GxxExxY protein [Bacteroidales bacterium]